MTIKTPPTPCSASNRHETDVVEESVGNPSPLDQDRVGASLLWINVQGGGLRQEGEQRTEDGKTCRVAVAC